jgi:protein O-mannosyl-transferase
MKITNKLVISLIGLLLLLAYGHTLHFPFQFDDYNVIVDEPKVHSLSAWWQSMPSMRPLLKLSYALNWQLEQTPRFFRVFNLLCHFVTSILVWRLCMELLPYLRKNATDNNKIALLTAVLFALHPAHSEVVTYISSRSTGLMAMFCVASIFYWIKYNHANLKNRVYLAASLIFWLCAVLTKEPAIILPAIAGLIAWFCYPQHLLFEKIKSKYMLFLIVPIVAYLFFTPQYQRLMLQLIDINALKNQFMLQPMAHIHYLTQTLFGLNLNIDYAIDAPNTSYSLACLAALGTLIFLAFTFKHQYSLFSFCVFWWFICLIPTNSLIPRLDLINDRQIYLASMAPIMFASVCLIIFSEKLKKLKWIPPATLILLVFSATWLRNWDYESEVTLWQSSLRLQANNSRAWNNLGYAYLQTNNKQEAKNAFENALKLDENNYKALFNLRGMSKPN